MRNRIESAARSGRKSVLLGIISSVGANARDADGSMLDALLSNGQLALADWLAERGGRVTQEERTLYKLLAKGQHGGAEWLLARGANPWAPWGNGEMDCTMAAAYCLNQDIIDWLLERGVPPEPPPDATVHGLLGLAISNRPDWPRPPLHDQLKRDLERGANPNRERLGPARSRMTLFQQIISLGPTGLGNHMDVASTLDLFLAHGGDPERPDSQQRNVWTLLASGWPSHATKWAARRDAWRLAGVLPAGTAKARQRL